MSEPLSNYLRRAIRECGRTRYALSDETGIDQAALCRFMQGGGLTLNSVEKLMEVLDLEVRPRRKARSTKVR
jgi:hypothetical protein